MKIFPILSTQTPKQYRHYNVSSAQKKELAVADYSDIRVGYYMPLENSKNYPKTISFLGKLVHIVDGGTHADNMRHFLKSVRNDVEISMHDVVEHKKYRGTKQLKSAEEQLKLLNETIPNNCKDYIAIPILANVPLLNIQSQFNKIIDEDSVFTPENIKANKAKLLMFLKTLYDNPQQLSKIISDMDPCGQGIEYAYGVIREINKLVEKCSHVYVPSGHPNDLSIKWMASERGLKPELYNYVATGEDKNNVIVNMVNEIKNNNWYNFNLLSLSDAKVVGLKSKDWVTDYIYSAYDSCITDFARGVYNLTPLRKGDSLIGYSYHGKSNDYPYEEFPHNADVANLVKFVGKDKSEVLATEEETLLFLDCLRNGRPLEEAPDKLYMVNDVFYSWQIDKNKLELQGKYVNKDLSLFFDENTDGKIIFKKCDCEGDGRPSVMSIWGSCYSLMNAIAGDIGREESGVSDNDRRFHQSVDLGCYDIEQIPLEKDDRAKKSRLHYAAIHFSNANNIIKQSLSPKNISPKLSEPAELLATIYLEQGEYEKAEGCLNFAIDVLSRALVNRFGQGVKYKMSSDYRYDYSSYSYDSAYERYKNPGSLLSWMKLYSVSSASMEEPNLVILKLSLMYKKIAELCRLKHEYYPANVCEAASRDIMDCNARGIAVLMRRYDSIQYIGDLYSEIKPN